eukprot:TRINITY_DN14083_c0_g1_i1.p2 TRINITY_DN14083_c0_g1~~TRINITY_DN14083_c0_g1_i1.p2  ORF type:complete len:54 (+),score=4.90 TRINITY_DN14083_c0_g1_i1:407-568(+)
MPPKGTFSAHRMSGTILFDTQFFLKIYFEKFRNYEIIKLKKTQRFKAPVANWD